MQFGGRYLFHARRGAVWAALNDTSVLQAAIPGCRRIEWAGDNALELEIRVELGLAQPVFAGDLTLSNVVPAHRYTLSGRGRGGMLGRAEGAAHVIIEDAGDDTLLHFTAVGGADGGIMKLGQALIGRSATKLIDGFFLRFGEAMGVEVTPVGE